MLRLEDRVKSVLDGRFEENLSVGVHLKTYLIEIHTYLKRFRSFASRRDLSKLRISS